MTYKQALKRIVKITDGKCFLTHGSLLGYVREGGMIKGDKDMDIGMLEEDWQDGFLQKVKEDFGKVSVSYWQDHHKIVDGSKRGKISKIKIHEPNICLDIWTKAIDGDRYIHSIKGDFMMKTPEKFLKRFKKVEFLGTEVKIPSKAEEYLLWNYGKDWGKPDPDWRESKAASFVKEKKAVIAAASIDNGYWKNHLGIPRQLVEVNGQILIRRTIRQLKLRGYDVAITLPKKNFLGDLGVREIICPAGDRPIQKILNLTKEVPCLMIYGDVYYTEKAMDTITEDNSQFMFFGREGEGIIKKCGEPFAINMDRFVIEKAEELRDMDKNTPMKRCGEWELYRLINGIHLNEHKVTDHWTEISDITDDIDTVDNYNAFKEYFKENVVSDSLTHIVISRMHYENKKDLLDRIKIYEANLLPVLLNQTCKNFDIGILCREEHKDIIQDIHPRIIPFFTKKKPDRIGKSWHIFSKWKDIVGLEKYDIQTNIDSDDLISLDAIKIIRDSITTRKSTHIHFFPILRSFFTGELFDTRIEYGEHNGSAFYSLYQPDKKKYTYIGENGHTRFMQYAERTILIPKGHSFVNIHDTNNTTNISMAKEEKTYEPTKLNESSITASVSDDIVVITNIKNTLSAGYGTDLIFEPNETKVLKREIAEMILRNSDDFKRGV